jgi:hypothetical protein
LLAVASVAAIQSQMRMTPQFCPMIRHFIR